MCCYSNTYIDVCALHPWLERRPSALDNVITHYDLGCCLKLVPYPAKGSTKKHLWITRMSMNWYIHQVAYLCFCINQSVNLPINKCVCHIIMVIICICGCLSTVTTSIQYKGSSPKAHSFMDLFWTCFNHIFQTKQYKSFPKTHGLKWIAPHGLREAKTLRPTLREKKPNLFLARL